MGKQSNQAKNLNFKKVCKTQTQQKTAGQIGHRQKVNRQIGPKQKERVEKMTAVKKVWEQVCRGKDNITWSTDPAPMKLLKLIRFGINDSRVKTS